MNSFENSTANMQRVTVMIADDHKLFVEGLKIVLQGSRDYLFTVVGEAADGEELTKLVKLEHPDLLILDLNMPGKDGLKTLSELRSQLRDTKILVLTMYDEAKMVKTVFKLGADGYLLKNTDRNDLLQAITTVLEGNTYVGDGVWVDENRQRESSEAQNAYEDKFLKKYNLTKRELEILKLITRAMSNKQIAKELYISDQTVSVHRKNIMRKLGVSNATGLMKIAYDSSII